MPWPQTYDPLGSLVLSTLLAALPVVVLLGGLARPAMAGASGRAGRSGGGAGGGDRPVRHARAAWRSPAPAYGAAYGLLPIGWIVLNVIFLYQLTNERGLFDVLRQSITHVTDDRRLQLLVVAFCFGAFFEGAAGFGTPVAVTGAILIGLGFSPLAASGLSLIANTAPVAFGALGTPIIALQSVTGLDLLELSGMVGRQLPLFSVIVPFWLVCAFAGWRGMLEVWPAILVAGTGLRDPAVPRLQLSRPVARGRRRGRRVDGAGGVVPARVASRRACGRRPAEWGEPARGTDVAPQGSDGAPSLKRRRSGARGRRGSSSASSSSSWGLPAMKALARFGCP